MADQRLEYIISAVNRAQGAFRQLETDLRRAGVTQQQFNDAARRGGAQSRQSLAQTAQAATATSRAVQRMGQAGTLAFAALQRSMNSARSGLQAFSTVAQQAARLATSSLAVGLASVSTVMALLAKRGVDVNVSLQRTAAGLAVLLGSTRQAQGLLGALRQEARTSAFEFVDLAQWSRQLIAFGFSAREVLPTLRALGDAAAGLAGEDGAGALLGRLVLAVGQIRAKGVLQGEEALQLTEAGIPVRDLLRIPPGTDVADAGLTADRALPQLLAGIQRRFGGLQSQAVNTIPGLLSNINDALNDFSATITETFSGRVQGGLQSALRALNGLMTSAAGGRIIEGLSAAFDALGRVLGWVADQGGRVTQWLSELVTRENIAVFVSNALGLLQTLGDRLLKLFGVDLKKALDPNTIKTYFDAFGQMIANLINTVFGLGRVWNEVKMMVATFAVESGFRVNDFIQDTMRGFRKLFFGVQRDIHLLSQSILDAFITISRALNEVRIFGQKPFNINVDGDGGLQKQSGAAYMRAWRASQAMQFVDDEEKEAKRAQAAREATLNAADPFRNVPAHVRIADAFLGRGRNTSAQAAFWADFERNRQGIARFLFAGSARPETEATAGVPPAMLLGGGGGGSSVTTVPPLWPPQGMMPPQVMPTTDPFAPTTLPDGRVVSRVAAMQMGGGAGGGSAQIVINVEGMDPRRIAEIVERELSRQFAPAFPGPSGF